MKKIALITSNKILAQSFESAIKTLTDEEYEIFLLLNTKQALLDAEIFQIDVALIDISLFDFMDYDKKGKETAILFCEDLHKSLPNCHLLLLVSQDDNKNRNMAIEAKKNRIIDDYVFYDASLKYLFAKLAAF